MQIQYPLPSPLDLGALTAQVRALGLPGFDGLGATDALVVLFVGSPTLTDAQRASLDAAIAGYTYQAPPPPPDVPGFLRAIPLDGKLSTASTEAIVTSGAGQLALQALTLGDFAHFQARYNDIKAAPPSPATTADVAEFAALAQASNIPITP